MGPRLIVLLLLLIVACRAAVSAGGGRCDGVEKEEEEPGGGEGSTKAGLFMMERSKLVMKTEAGEVRVSKGSWGKGGPPAMHLGFVSMEPNSLLLPQYMDATVVVFVRKGEAKVGWIYEDELVERQLKVGDLYWIPAGSAFYIVNTGRGQQLRIICSINTSEGLKSYDGFFQSFFIGGGSNPPSVLAGFDIHTLSTAFNVSGEELSSVMRQAQGPIIYMTAESGPEGGRSLATALLRSKGRSSTPSSSADDVDEDEKTAAAGTSTRTWRNLLSSILWKNGYKKVGGAARAPDPYNLYERSPDFSNSYGSSVAVGRHDWAPLEHAGVGAFLVELTAGAMMAPHVNPTAAESAVVLSGAGRVRVVFPNGTSAMDAEVREEDAFWVPRHHPFCHVASRGGPMVFFGFTTSSRRNRPLFLVGASSVVRSMMGPEMAAAFGTTEERLRRVVEAQNESVILPPGEEERRGAAGERW